MSRPRIRLDQPLLDRCYWFGCACAIGYRNHDKDESLYYSTHGVERDPILLAESKMAECAVATWTGQHPDVAVDWSPRPDAGFDVRYGHLKVDVAY